MVGKLRPMLLTLYAGEWPLSDQYPGVGESRAEAKGEASPEPPGGLPQHCCALLGRTAHAGLGQHFQTSAETRKALFASEQTKPQPAGVRNPKCAQDLL